MNNSRAAEADRQAAIDALRVEIKSLVHNPINVWAVAATIESLGIRDIDARQDYGFESVFTLADAVYKAIKLEFAEENEEEEEAEEVVFEREPWYVRSRDFAKYYSLGLWFAMPMVVQIFAILTFRYSLWAWLDFNEAQATVVALGTIASFIITGGFVQTMGRQVTGYRGAENYKAVYAISRAVITWGCITVLGVAVFLYTLNLVIPFYPQIMMVLSLVYMVLISFLLLSASVLYAMEERAMITISVVIGTAFVIMCMEIIDLGIYISHWVGLSIAVIVMTLYGLLILNIRVRSMRSELALSKLPGVEVIFYNSYRNFLYGLLYFLFLFMDRILAWSAGPPPPAYIIWFDTPYELGMDWALISLVLTLAVLEYSIHSFSKQLIPILEKTVFNRVDLFTRHFKAFYRKQLILLFVVGCISIFLTYILVESLVLWADQIPEIRDFFANPITPKVFWLAAVGYLLLSFGLLNALFFFTLNRAAFVLNAMVYATLVNFVVGYCCSRMISYEYGVIGLIAGALTFAVLTGRAAWRFFNRLDYFYYAAY